MALAGGLAGSAGLLVAARAVQGLGGAFLAPATLSLVTTTFAEGRERNRALGIWGASGSSGMVLGSLLGGVLTQTFGWSAVFFVNVPLAVGIAALALTAIPADPPPAAARSFDLPGSVTATGGVSLLVFALVEGPALGWAAPVTPIAFAAAAVLIGAFLLIESRTAQPLVPLRVFRHRNLSVGALITFTFMATFGASAYFLTLALQRVHGWGAFATGLAFVVPCACVLIGTIIGGRAVTARGARTTLVAALVVGAAGTALFAFTLTAGGTYPQMLPGLVVFSVAQGVVFTAMFSAATSGVDPQLQGLASGVATSGQQIGGAVGLAVLVAVTAAVSGTDPAPAELAEGLRAAMFTAAALILLGTALALALRNPAPGGEPAAEPSLERSTLSA